MIKVIIIIFLKKENQSKKDYKKAQTTVLAISCSIIGALLLILCLMDVPFVRFYKMIKSRVLNIQPAKRVNTVSPKDNDTVPSGAMISSEKELLNKFKLAMKQSKSRSRSRSSRSSISSSYSPKIQSPNDLNPIKE